jgi:hypothetical protein
MPSGENCFRFRLYTSLAVTAASPIAPVRFLMQMSARNAFGVRYVFDGRSHDRLAQRSSGLSKVRPERSEQARGSISGMPTATRFANNHFHCRMTKCLRFLHCLARFFSTEGASSRHLRALNTSTFRPRDGYHGLIGPARFSKFHNIRSTQCFRATKPMSVLGLRAEDICSC